MNFLKVLWSDISNIFRNRFIRVSVIAVIMIPLIYGGLYLAAFWNPYGKTENLPVAVVNLDKGGIQDDEKVNYGEDIVDKLKNNEDLAWKFVKTQKEAEDGLEGNKYYAMIVIPDNFSQRLIDADKGKQEKPKLIFVANKKKNYVVGLITEKAASALKNDVSKGIMDNFTDKIFDNLYDIRDGMEAAADGTSQIKDGVTDLKDKVPSMEDGINKLYDGASTLNDKLHDASDGGNKLKDSLGTLNSKMPDLVDGVSKLYKGSSSLDQNIDDALDGSRQLRDGVASLKDKMPDLSDGVNQLYDGSTSLREGLEETHDNMPKLVKGVSDLRDGAGELKDGISSAESGASSLDEGVGKIQDSVTHMQSMIIGDLRSNLPLSDMANLFTAVAKYQGLGVVFPDNVTQSMNTLVGLNNDMQQLANAIDTNNIAQTTTSAIKLADDLQKMQQSSTQIDTSTLPPDIQTPLNNITSKLNYIQYPLALLLAPSQVKSGADSLKSGLGSLYDGSDKLYKGIDDLYDSVEKLQHGVDILYDGSQNLRDGIDKFKGTVPNLTNGISNLSDGSRDLSDGLFKINEGSATLTEKLGELNQKMPDMQDGVQQLYDGSTDLSDGLLKLGDGSIHLRDGLQTLKDKMPDLKDGVNKLYEGIAQLNDELKEGASKLADKLVVSSKAMGKFMSDPVKLQDKPSYEVSKYGEGMAPYFISLALWVGALMMFFVITEKVEGDVKVGPISIVLGKYLSYVLVGILQALLISFTVMKIGLRPSNVLVYYLFNIFLSFVFVAIIQNFIFLLGDAGRLLAVIILVLQLTSSNGTFPGELLPKFFRTIGPYLPFTYSISALREINSGIDHAVLIKDVAILSAYMIVFLICSVLLKRHTDNLKKKFKGESIEGMAKEIDINNVEGARTTS